MNNQISESTPIPSDSGIGFLIVRVTTALGAIPIEGASVTVRSYEDDERIFATSETDRNGNTGRLSLPAPGYGRSFEPGGEAPFSTYNISAYAPGYKVQFLSNVPIFDSITSIQQVDLIPLSEAGGRTADGAVCVDCENKIL